MTIGAQTGASWVAVTFGTVSMGANFTLPHNGTVRTATGRICVSVQSLLNDR